MTYFSIDLSFVNFLGTSHLFFARPTEIPSGWSNTSGKSIHFFFFLLEPRLPSTAGLLGLVALGLAQLPSHP